MVSKDMLARTQHAALIVILVIFFNGCVAHSVWYSQMCFSQLYQTHIYKAVHIRISYTLCQQYFFVIFYISFTNLSLEQQ